MSFAKLAAASPMSRAIFVLIACLSLGLLSGCGGAWQPDRQDQTRPSVDGRGIYGPAKQDSKLDL